MLGGFAGAIHHFGKAVAQGAMVIQFGESQVFVGERAQGLQRLVYRRFPGLYALQQLSQAFYVHIVSLSTPLRQ